MSSHRRRNVQGVGKQIPGCLGRMVNLFDLGTDISGNKMLTDKPHFNGSYLSRSRSDVSRMPSHIGDRIEDKVVVSEVRSTTNRVNGTPMKKLIAEEMSKEMDNRLSPTNVVAKLMGLDSLPQPLPNAFVRTSNLKGRSRRSLSHEAIALRCWEQDCDHGYQDHAEYKDVYEIWQKPQKLNNGRNGVADKGRHNESLSEKKMDFVREKFMEAKRLVTDGKLRHSKEFQDAVEVLSSNKDLFVKFLQESNFFSQHLHDFQPMATPPETKRITILKPSKMTEDEKLAGQMKNDKQTNKTTTEPSWGSKNSEFGLPFLNRRVDEYPIQSTRIVVLKPHTANGHCAKALASSCPTFPGDLRGEKCNEELVDFEERESRDVARRVTKQMHANLMELQRDETLQSSVFSNGYVGDDGSFNGSENDYVAAENLIDSEIMSPACRHSWDYINRYDSPYSSSPFSRASCSPESSVCREAKKRLSERWALMASNGNFQEQKVIQKSSSTLGEMLALSGSKKELRTEEASDNNEQDHRVSTSCLTGSFSGDQGHSNSPKSLQRSKSVPESSTVYKTSLDFKVSDTMEGKAKSPEELTKSKSLKLSLKGKVSNFFFARKASKEKSNTSQSKDESQAVAPETQDSPALHLAQASDHASPSANDGYIEQSSLLGTGQSGSVLSREQACLSIAQPTILGSASESRDLPSPISVLETSFDEDDRVMPDSSVLTKPASLVIPSSEDSYLDRYSGKSLGSFPKPKRPELSLRSNLIDKSPPIGSIARTLSRDDSRAETTARRTAKRSASSSTDTEEEEEEDWRLLVNTLLSAADLDAESLSDNLPARWHSAESPLDPSLRNKYASSPNDLEATIHGAKRQKLRSNRKLLFDLVNSSLLEMTTGNHFLNGKQRATLGDCIWTQMQEWFTGSGQERWDEDCDLSSLAVDRVVRSEVAEQGWPENTRWERDDMGKELEGKLLEELVEEAVTDLTHVGSQ